MLKTFLLNKKVHLKKSLSVFVPFVFYDDILLIQQINDLLSEQKHHTFSFCSYKQF